MEGAGEYTSVENTRGNSNAQRCPADLPDVFEALTLLFVDDVKTVTRRIQNMSIYSSLTAAWEWSKKWDLPINPTKCNYLTIG